MTKLMKRAVHIFVALCWLGLPSHLFGQKPPTIDVTGPTIVAFFPPMSDAELAQSPDTNEALSDFQFYAGQVRQPLAKRGITFKEVYVRRFTIRQGTTTTMFAPANVKVGYCLVAPGKEPLVQLGVMTDTALLRLAEQYFSTGKK
jgi:hypothetical protein